MFLVGVLVLPIVLANGYGDMYGGSSVDGGYSGGGGYGGSGGGGYHDGYDTEHVSANQIVSSSVFSFFF